MNPSKKVVKDLISLSLFFFYLPLYGYSQTILSGFVQDEKSGEPLVGAHLYISSVDVGTSTNNEGYFALSLQKGEYDIKTTYVGYNDSIVSVKLEGSKELLILLRGFHQMKTVVVMDSILPGRINNLGNVSPAVSTLNQIPSLAGERDLLKALTFFPGISSGREGTSGLFVRGGTSDQNLYLLDDVPLYNLNHLFGFLSVFNPVAIKSMQVQKSFIQPRYGGRLSSVVDVVSKDGSNLDHGRQFSIGLLSSSVALDGPIKKDRSSYMIAGRAGYMGLIALPLRLLYNARKSENYINYL